MSRYNQVGSHKTTTLCTNGRISIIYHNTEVVLVERDKNLITLNTGGWKSNTTKLRMNQASQQFNLGYSVYQKDYSWYVDYKGKTIPFDGNTLVLEM